jgi:hypothetical protein
MRGAGTMRAAVLTGPGRVRMEEVAIPQPGAGQVRIRLVLQLCFLRTLPISLADLYGGVEYGGRIDERSRLAG